MPGGGNPDYSSLATWEAASDNDLAAYTGPVILDCYDSQEHTDYVTSGGAANTSSTIYRHIRSSASCAVPWAGKKGTGANFKHTSNGAIFTPHESYFRISDLYAELAVNSTSSTFYVVSAPYSSEYYGRKFINVVAKATNAGTGGGSGFYVQYVPALFYNCIALNCEHNGFYWTYNWAGTGFINCTAIGNGLGGFSSNNHSRAWNCYAADNAGGDFYGTFLANGGWCASKDNSASKCNATYYKHGLDLITSGDLGADGLATADDLYAAGGAGDSYGRNPYDDHSATIDYYDFLKNDAAGDALSKKDIKGTDRPTPDTADCSWNVGASESGSTAALPYDDGTSSGGIVFGGEVVEVATLIASDGVSSGGIVFGGAETSTPENHQNDGISFGGIVFGGESAEQWQAEPNNMVAVKGGTYRISGVIYTLTTTMSYPGLGNIAALVNCGVPPAATGCSRYDLLSVDTAGTITVTAGTEELVPIMPATPTGELKIDHVLRYNGQTSIIQSDIGKLYTMPYLASIVVDPLTDSIDSGSEWVDFRIDLFDQYGQVYIYGAVVTASIMEGEGNVTPSSVSIGAAGYTTLMTYMPMTRVYDYLTRIKFSASGSAGAASVTGQYFCAGI